MENRYRCKDGSYKWIDWRVRVDSSEKRFYAVGRDVTQQKEAESRLKRAIDKADRANRAKSEFLANMSHEIRTPLSGLVTMTKVLQDTNLDARQSKYANAILLSAETLVQILDDILDLTKFESGHITISDTNFSLAALLAHCASLFQPLAQAKGLGFRMEKALQGHGWVRGDKIRVYQVIANLISNAIKFTERGSVNCRVSLEEQEGTGYLLRVSVQDTGPGISPAQKRTYLRPLYPVERGLLETLCRYRAGTHRIQILGRAHAGTHRFGVRSRERELLPFRTAAEKSGKGRG